MLILSEYLKFYYDINILRSYLSICRDIGRNSYLKFYGQNKRKLLFVSEYKVQILMFYFKFKQNDDEERQVKGLNVCFKDLELKTTFF